MLTDLVSTSISWTFHRLAVDLSARGTADRSFDGCCAMAPARLSSQCEVFDPGRERSDGDEAQDGRGASEPDWFLVAGVQAGVQGLQDLPPHDDVHFEHYSTVLSGVLLAKHCSRIRP